MVNLKDLLTEFEPQEITSAKVLNIGGEYVVSKDNRFSYSGRNSSLASEQIALLGMYVCELLTKEPKKPNKMSQLCVCLAIHHTMLHLLTKTTT